MTVLEKLLEYVEKSDSSDLHLSAGNIPMTRTNGELSQIPNTPKLTNQMIFDMLTSIMSDYQREKYKKNLELDFSLQTKSDTRFRVNAFWNVVGASAVFRLVPSKAMSLDEIKAPQILKELCKLTRGLVLIVGHTGCGKSTTLAAMIDHINQNHKKHVISVEDPIEFIFRNDKALVNQREIGANTLSFPNALRSSLREDPDIIMVSEMRDLETIRLALTAAETGHLVFGTLHTSSAAQSINRMIDVFPPQDKAIIRSMLSSSIQAIISQRLLKKIGGGRCAAFEVLLGSSSVRNMIREDQIPQIASVIEISKKHGMVGMKDSVEKLVNDGYITMEDARDLLLSFG